MLNKPMDQMLPQIFAGLDVWQILAVAVKALTYSATFISTGGIVFLFLFSAYSSAQAQSVIRRFVFYTALVGIVSSVARIAVMNSMLSGEWRGMFDIGMTRMVLASKEGLATGSRLLGLLLLVISVRSRMSSWRRVIGFASAAIAATSFSWVGHAGEIAMKAGPEKLPQLLLSLHLLAIAFWLGALWPLHRCTYGENIHAIAAIMYRFGRIAAFVVALLVAGGALLLWLIIGDVSALWNSAYGQSMLTKLCAVALLLALAALNKLRLTPLLLNGDSAAIYKLRYSIKAEMVLAALILLITAFFTTVVGPTRP
ncbi:MAG: CopD family protein [Pseudomonadota bacterium]